VRVLRDPLGLEQIEALGAAEVDRAVAALVVSAGVELTALQPVGDGIRLDLLRGGVESSDPTIAADPELSRRVDRDPVHRGSRQPVRFGEVLEFVGAAIEAIEPIRRADPDDAGRRLDDRLHRRSADAVLADRVRPLPSRGRIELVHASADRAEQEPAVGMMRI
jgi:hypothetical protein